jgi:cytochrome c oxidase subunit 2
MYMPYFRVQMNAVPGLPTFFKFVPTITTDEMRVKQNDPKFEYLFYCAKICGDGHYNMKKVVRVVSEAEYHAMASAAKTLPDRRFEKRVEPCGCGCRQTSGVTNGLALNN